MTISALSSAGMPLMGIAAEMAMGMFFAPATHVGVIDKAPRERLSDAARDAMVSGQRGRCAKCGTKLDASNTEIDHKWPIAKGGQNWAVNLQALCMPCNRSKGAKLEPVVLDILTGALPAVWDSGILQRGRDWLSKLEFGRLLEAGNLTGQASALLPVVAISPTTALLIVGGVVLVVVGVFAVKWLMENADGERRYVRLTRNVRDSLVHLAHHAGGLTRHLEGASAQARRIGAAATNAARSAGGAATQAGQVPAYHISKAAGQVPGRVGDVAVAIRDASVTHAPVVAGHAAQVTGRAARVSGMAARTAVGGARAGVGNAPGLARGVAGNVRGKMGRVAGGMGRLRGRKAAQPATAAAAATDGPEEVAARRWV